MIDTDESTECMIVGKLKRDIIDSLEEITNYIEDDVSPQYDTVDMEFLNNILYSLNEITSMWG